MFCLHYGKQVAVPIVMDSFFHLDNRLFYMTSHSGEQKVKIESSRIETMYILIIHTLYYILSDSIK